MSTSTPRCPRGVPTGGQFAARNRNEAALDLGIPVASITPEQFPISLLHDYDRLDMVGNDGWTVERITQDVRRTGRIRRPLDIGFSAAEVANGNYTIYVFDGHHRLAVARTQAIYHVRVRSAWRADDAVPIAGIPDEFGDDNGEIGLDRAVGVIG